ncbi:uncharacterized protein LOC144457560 isoform X3 [Phascolarctos cinereus]
MRVRGFGGSGEAGRRKAGRQVAVPIGTPSQGPPRPPTYTGPAGRGKWRPTWGSRSGLLSGGPALRDDSSRPPPSHRS